MPEKNDHHFSPLNQAVKLAPTHHSVSDWDFEDSNWELTSERYVYPPTSLKKKPPIERCAILCRLPLSLRVPEGRMVTWLWDPWRFSSTFIFRAQTALGTANHLNNYSLRTASTGAIALWLTQGGVEEVIDVWWDVWVVEEWNRLRVTWWNGYDPHDAPALVIHLEREEAGAWVSKGYLYDTNNRWANSTQNRCGVELRRTGQFLDETEIWIPVG